MVGTYIHCVGSGAARHSPRSHYSGGFPLELEIGYVSRVRFVVRSIRCKSHPRDHDRGGHRLLDIRIESIYPVLGDTHCNSDKQR